MRRNGCVAKRLLPPRSIRLESTQPVVLRAVASPQPCNVARLATPELHEKRLRDLARAALLHGALAARNSSWEVAKSLKMLGIATEWSYWVLEVPNRVPAPESQPGSAALCASRRASTAVVLIVRHGELESVFSKKIICMQKTRCKAPSLFIPTPQGIPHRVPRSRGPRRWSGPAP